MGLSVSAQMMEFICSAIFGVGIGVFYDFLAVIRSYLMPKKIVNILFDIIFWTVSAFALLAFVLLATDGAMRWYVLLGTFLGIFIYKNTISGLFFCAIRSIISMSTKLLHFLVRPLYAFFNYIKKCKTERTEKKRRRAENGKKKKKA